MGLYSSGQLPDTTSGIPNVSQFGWTPLEYENVQQIIDYVEEVKGYRDEVVNLINEGKELVGYIDSKIGEFSDKLVEMEQAYTNILNMYKIITADFAEIRKIKVEIEGYRDIVKDYYDQIVLIRDDVTVKYGDILDKHSAVIATGIQVSADAASAKDSETKSKQYFEETYNLYLELKKGLVYRGTWNPNSGTYPDPKGTNSTWDVVLNPGQDEVNALGKKWYWGDRLLFLTDGAEYQQIEAGSVVKSVNGRTGAVVLTAEDLGAVKKTGDTMTGSLTVSKGSVIGNLVHSDGYFEMRPYNSGYGATGDRSRMYFKMHDQNNPDALNPGFLITANKADGTNVQPNIWLNGNKVYHQGYKPTASDVGAYTKAETDKKITDTTYTKAEINTKLSAKSDKTYTDSMLAQKVDKLTTVNGKPLSANVNLSAADVNALPITGGTMSGTLTIKNNAPILKLEETDSTTTPYMLVVDGGNIRMNVRTTSGIDDDVVWKWSETAREFTTPGKLFAKNGLWDNDKRVYSANNKPTPSDIGVVDQTSDTNYFNLLPGLNSGRTKEVRIYSKDNNLYTVAQDGTVAKFYNDKSYKPTLADFGGLGVENGNELNIPSNKDNFFFGYRKNGTEIIHYHFANGKAQAGQYADITAKTVNAEFVALRGASRITGNQGSVLIRDHGNGNVTYSASKNNDGAVGDLYLGYTHADGSSSTRNVRLEAPITWKSSHTFVDSSGNLNSDRMYGDRARVFKTRNGDKSTTEQDQVDVVIGDQTNRGGGVYISGGESQAKILAKHEYGKFEGVVCSGDGNEGFIAYTGMQTATSAMTEGPIGKVAFTDGSVRAFGVQSNNSGFSKYANLGVGANDVYLHNSKSSKYLQLRDTGELWYDSKKVYHEGFKPTASAIGAFPVGANLTSTNNLNDIKTAGVYGNSANNNATSANNYPIQRAGVLTVTQVGGTIVQVYTTYADKSSNSAGYRTPYMFQRSLYNNIWSPWTSNSAQGWGTGVDTGFDGLEAAGGVADFNRLKTSGLYTISGTWSNGINNGAATGHTGTLLVIQRKFDNHTVQIYNHVTQDSALSVVVPKQFTRVANGSTWGQWYTSGVWENTSLYRSGILRHNKQDGTDDSNIPYYSICKEKLRVGQTGFYGIGDIHFKAEPTNRYDPHTGTSFATINASVNGGDNNNGRLWLRAKDNKGSDITTLSLEKAGVICRSNGKNVVIHNGTVVSSDNISAEGDGPICVRAHNRKANHLIQMEAQPDGLNIALRDASGKWEYPITFNMGKRERRDNFVTVCSNHTTHYPNTGIAWNAHYEGASGLGWLIQENVDTGDIEWHNYQSSVWTQRSYMFQSTGNAYAIAGWHVGSDKGFKDNIKYLTPKPSKRSKSIVSYLDKVCSLKAASFNYKETEKSRLGFIAQDVQGVIPEAVSSYTTLDDKGENKGDRLYLDPLAIIAAQNEAIKELRQMVLELQEKIK